MKLPSIGSLFNVALVKEPMNWAIVFIIATIWLLAFHTVMQAFGAMQTTVQGAFGGNAPGVTSSPAAPGTTAAFSTAGMLDPSSPVIPGIFQGGATQMWADAGESKYAEDGWTGNA